MDIRSITFREETGYLFIKGRGKGQGPRYPVVVGSWSVANVCVLLALLQTVAERYEHLTFEVRFCL